MEENEMIRAYRALCSPDLALSGFFVFYSVKINLSGRSLEEGGDILSAVAAILESIEKATFDTVFLEWRERIRRCIDINSYHVA
jgi:hypothetical protein